MSLHKYLERIRLTDSLIRKKATGNIESLAKKLNLSKSGMEKFLHEMKEEGFPISYCKKRKIYFYKQEGKMAEKLFVEEKDIEDMKKIMGGKSFFDVFPKRNYSRLSKDNFTF
jgi:Mn-dependent DtxR family transcriptional regulator